MQYTTRREWNARPPRDVATTSWSRRTHFAVHYSAASASQTPRQIQDFHMDTRGWDDIGYNWLVHSVSGEIFEGRGWLTVGAHIAGYNTTHIGVCVIGRDLPDRKDVSEAARRSVRVLLDEATRRKGSPLFVVGHRDRAATTCPGDELYTWLKFGMPLGGPDPKPPAPAPAHDWTEKLVMAQPTIKRGSTGTDVRTAQGLLVARGHPVKVDGVFGPDTDDKTRDMQRRYGAEHVDGLWGPETWTIGLTGEDGR